MHKTDIEKLALQLCIDRYKIFISFCSADIDKVGDIIRGVESLDICYWSMFYENNVQRNFAGEQYEKEINTQLHKTCLMIPVLSKILYHLRKSGKR